MATVCLARCLELIERRRQCGCYRISGYLKRVGRDNQTIERGIGRLRSEYNGADASQ